MDLQNAGEADKIALRKERRFACYEGVHSRARNAEILRCAVRHTLLLGNVGAYSRALAFQLGIQHCSVTTVAAQNMFAFVAKDEPEVIDAVEAQRHSDHRGGVI